MTKLTDTLTALRQAGTAQNRKVYGRRGVSTEIDAMNSALIAIGLQGGALERNAVAAAKRIGKVDVDHGETSCKTPDAVSYIARAKARAAKRS